MTENYTKYGLSPLEVVALSEKLNTIIANYSVLNQKFKNFHWNVVGADFFELHDLFEHHSREAINKIDLIAERIRYFDLNPLSTLEEYLEVSEIKEVKQVPTSFEMVKTIKTDYEVLINHIYSSVSYTKEIGDPVTERILVFILRDIEKMFWQINSWLKLEKKI